MMTRVCIAAAIVIAALYALALARCAKDDDWRSEWCSLECWAPDGQERPCEGCLRRRS